MSISCAGVKVIWQQSQHISKINKSVSEPFVLYTHASGRLAYKSCNGIAQLKALWRGNSVQSLPLFQLKIERHGVAGWLNRDAASKAGCSRQIRTNT